MIGHHEVLISVMLWIDLALLFCVGIYFYGLYFFPQDPMLIGYDPQALAKQCSLEFLSGWFVEKNLSIDKLFIFLVVFYFFAISPEIQTQDSLLCDSRSHGVPTSLYCSRISSHADLLGAARVQSDPGIHWYQGRIWSRVPSRSRAEDPSPNT